MTNDANEPIPAPPTTGGLNPTKDTAASEPTGTAAPVDTTGMTPGSPIGPTENIMPPDKLQPAPEVPEDAQGRDYSPFTDEQRVMESGIPLRDDISATQMSGQATRAVSSQHLTRLLYRPLDNPGGPVYQSQQLERRLKSE